jgi:hypothetical protein
MPMHLAECPVSVSLCSLLVSNREYDRSPVGKQQVAVAVFDVGFSEFRIRTASNIEISPMALANENGLAIGATGDCVMAGSETHLNRALHREACAFSLQVVHTITLNTVK